MHNSDNARSREGHILMTWTHGWAIKMVILTTITEKATMLFAEWVDEFNEQIGWIEAGHACVHTSQSCFVFSYFTPTYWQLGLAGRLYIYKKWGIHIAC